MPVYLAKRKILKYKPSSSAVFPYALYLPQAGPFAGLTLTPVSGLSDQTISSGTTSINTTAAAPLQKKTLTVNGTGIVGFTPTGQAKQFVWIDKLVIGGSTSSIRALGTNGFGGTDDGTGGFGGNGSGGASGGGGGAAWDNSVAANNFAGGSGGSKSNGVAGSTNGVNSIGGPGGTGWSTDYASGYTYGNGEDGQVGAGSPYSNFGAGGNGFGGGGAGGGIITSGAAFEAGGGGGGGGGLLVYVGNWIDVSGTLTITVNGGSGGAADGINSFAGGRGGKGVIYWAFVKKTGGAPTLVGTTGSTRIFEISRDWSTLTEHANWADTWNNLD